MNKFNKLIFIIIDGVPYRVFEELVYQNKLPNIRKHIMSNGVLMKGVSAFPSTTGPAFVPFFTGLFPGTANIPGIRWMSKKDYPHISKYKRPAICSYMGPEGLSFNDDLVGVKTLFQYFDKSSNIYNLITKGVSKDLTKNNKLRHYAFSYLTKNWSFTDRKATDFLLKAINDDYDFISCLYPGVDEYAHLKGVKNKKTLDEYTKIDEDLGKAFDLLMEKGIYEETLFVITSDHGLSDTHTHIDLEGVLTKKGYKCLHFPLLHMKDTVCASMVSGNAMSNIYIKESNIWGNAKLSIDDDKASEIVKIVTSIDGVDFVCGLDKDRNINVVNKNGKGVIYLKDGSLDYNYKGVDPLGLSLPYDNLDIRDSISATINTDYPDLFIQLIQIFKSNRAGDLIVTSKPGYDLRAKYEFHKHHASHGSLHKEQMLVPVLLNYPLKERVLRTVDVFPTILNLMGKNIEQNLDGVVRH